jgi:hypothetical protein
MLLGDPVALYGQLQAFDAMRRFNTSAPEHWGSDALIEFFGGLVLSLPRADVIDRIGKTGPPDLIARIDAALQMFGQLELWAHLAKIAREGAEGRQQRIQLDLQLENLLDRMHGYIPHLRSILLAILQPLRRESLAHLGFDLADCIKATEAAIELGLAHIDAAEKQERQADEQDDAELMIRFLNEIRARATQLDPDLPTRLSAAAELQLDETTKLIDAMSVPIGQDLTLTSLSDDSPLRRKPIIAVDGSYIWTRPIDFYHMGLDWANDVCRDNQRLVDRLNKQRQDRSEDITEEALVSVPGRENVYKRIKYDLPGKPDIDVFVVLPDAMLVVEVKGGRFTESARRGSPGRVKKKSEEIIDKALDQNIRAWNYLNARTDGITHWSGKKLLIDPASHIVGLVVTLDHIDPFYGDVSDDILSRRGAFKNAILSLSDLLMVADILGNPAECFAYLSRRAEIATDHEFRVATEADVLGTWCTERIPRNVRAQAEREVRGLPTGNEALNEYYSSYTTSTLLPEHEVGPKPSSGMLTQVTAYLDSLYAHRSPTWAKLALEVGAVHPRRWVEVGRWIDRAANADPHASRKSRKRAARVQAGDGLAVNDRLRIRLHEGDVEVLLV